MPAPAPGGPQRRKHKARANKHELQADVRTAADHYSGSMNANVLDMAKKLNDVNERIVHCKQILIHLEDEGKAQELRLALEYLLSEKDQLFRSNSLTLDDILKAIYALKTQPDTVLARTREERRLEGLRMIEESISAGTRAKTPPAIIAVGVSRTNSKADNEVEISTRHSLNQLYFLYREFLIRNRGINNCPRCNSRNTFYQSYSVVLSSECIVCHDCKFLWHLPLMPCL